MPLKIFYQSVTGDFATAMEKAYRPMATAGKGALQEMAEIIKREGRADIAKAGFGRRWQNTFRVDVYPNGSKVSLNAAALIYHKIPYADVFEAGATIRGKPKLWIPLKDTPKKAGGRRMTPKIYDAEIGGLFPMRIKDKTYLGAKLSLSKAQARTGQTGKITTTRLRKGRAAELTRAVPLFVGVDSVTLRDRFSLREITDKSAHRLGELFAPHFDPEG